MAYSVDEIVKAYEILVKGIEADAYDDEERAFGGIIRAGKGKLVESIAKHMVEIAWENINGDPTRLSFRKSPYKIPIKIDYVRKIKDSEVKKYILNNIDNFFYTFKTDVHVSIDENMVMGIECKSYTENAMIKRILVDFTLLKSILPNVKCVLVQLESQLNGDYCKPLSTIIYGSKSTHTLMSYFNVDLNIITLLEGERKVNQPIHHDSYYKELKKDIITLGINKISDLLKNYL